MKKLTFEELLVAPSEKCLINEPLDFEVDFEVSAEPRPLTATEN
jgi:hypothetical protein